MKQALLALMLVSCTGYSHISDAIQISGNMVASGNVTNNYQISPDGRTVVYIADQDIDEVFELYSAPITGVAATKLNTDLVSGRTIDDFKISADGQRVIYIGDQGVNNIIELYSVPIEGGAAVQLNPSFAFGRNISSFKISPDSQRVIYIADQDTNNFNEIYSVPISGGPAVRLNGDLVVGGAVLSAASEQYQISANSQRVIYRADQTVNQVFELYSAPIAGGDATRLNDNLVDGGDVTSFRMSADSQRVIYIADQDIDEVRELYSVPTTGGTPIKLNPPPMGEMSSLVALTSAQTA